MMFKTADGELKVFNKTILSTQNNLKNLQAQTANLSYYTSGGNHVNLQNVPIAQPQTVSNFAKLNNAFNVYNNNLSKSTGLQNAYINSVGTQNRALGNYLAGLNGAPASFSGYIASLTKAKLATIALQAASIALNMALTAGVSVAISALFKGIDYLIHRTEKMQEALQNSVDKFNTATDELKSLEEELETTSERLNELQKLADNGTISVAEEAELETLKETNKELARKIALKQQDQANEARDVLKGSKKNANSTVASKYENKTTASGNYTYGVSITPDKELELAIKAYETSSKALENNRGTNLEGFYEDQIEAAKNRIEEMYDLISPTIGAYEDLINAGIKLEGEDKTRYEQLKKTQDSYLGYIYTLNGTREAFEGLNAEQQRNVLLNRLIKQELPEDVAKAIVGSISDEDLSKYWDKNFSFVPPEMKDGETAEEYGKRYAEAWAKGLEKGAKTTSDTLNETIITLDNLKEASESISTLSAAYKNLNEDGYITTENISKIKEAVGDSIDNWEDYENILLTAKEGSAELNKALSDITYAMLEDKFGTEGLANATEEQIAAVLRENGVINANAVAHDASVRAKGAAKAATFEFADSLDETAQKLIDEAEACGLTSEAYAQLVAQEIIFNNNELDVSGKIQKLAELQQALGVTASAAITLNSILSGQNVDSRIAMATALQEYGVKRTAKGYSYNGVEYKSGKAALQAAMMAEYNSTSKAPSPTIPDFSGALSDSKKKSSKDKTKDAADKLADYAEKVQDINEELSEKIQDINEDLAEKEKEFAENMAEAWEEEHLETLKDIIKEKEDLLERHSKSMEVIDFGLDIVGLNDFASRSDLLSSKLNEATQYGAGMRREFERLTAIIPQTAEEAEEIAGRIEALGSDMRENIKNIRETQVAIQMLRIEALDSVAEDRVSVLEAELDNIDKRISMLSSDNKNDYKYTNKILSMKSLIPDISSLKSAVDQKRNSDNQIIASEKNKQDTINKIVSDSLKKQAEANKKAREKERQQLIEDMDKARKDANEKLAEAREDAKKQLAEAHQDYVDYLEENELATDATIQSIENKFKNANIELPKVDASSLEKSVDEVINKIKNKNIDINIKTVISQEGSGGIPLSESTAARNIQGATDCVRYAYARKKEITGYQGDIRYSGNGGDLGDASLGNRKIKDPNLYRDNLKSGAIMTMANGVAINPMTGRPYGHAIVVEKYDAETDTMWYSDNTTRGIARPVNFGDFISRRTITGIIPVGVYAEGTGFHPGGKAILGDEKRGAYEAAVLPDGTVKIIGRNGAELVDLPRGTQVIPHEETKAIMSYTGNLDGKKVPKYATGTPTNDKELLSYITAASQEWSVPANIIMAVMDQESAYNWVIGDGGSSYGYMQLNKGGALAELKSKGYADLAEKATWDKYSNIYAGTWFLRYLYDRYGDWETTLARYNGSGQAAANYGKTVYARAQSDAFLNAFSSQNTDNASTSGGAQTQNTDTSSSTTSQADNTSKTDDYHDSVLGKIDDILYSIKMRKRTMGDEVDTSDLYREIQDIAHTEAQRLRDTGVPENSDEIRELIDVWWDAQDVIDGFVKTPAEEKFSEIQAMYDAFSAKVSESSIYSMAEQQKISDSDLSDDEKAKSLYRVANNVVESIGSISEAAYDEALTSFLAWVEGVSNGSIDFSQEVYDGYKELFNKIESSVYDAESGKSQRRQDLVGFMDKEIQNIDNYISTRDFYNDWGSWGDSKVSAIDRKIEIYKEYYNNGKDDIISTEEFNRYIVEAEHEKYTLMKEELVDYLNFAKEKFSSLQSLTKAHFEVLNNITEAQHEIDKELAASKTMYEYLDKETRKLLFNQEDYNILSEELISIQEEAQLLQQKFNRDIRKSKEENIEEITSQYEMQYNLLMKSYEIAKADLEVAKKKQKLNNVLNERNVRMFIDGEWTWVANTQDVIDAQAELADAKYSSAQSNTELEQTQSLNKLTSAQNTLTTTINDVENGIIKFDRKVLQINTKLGSISDSSIPALGKICDGATEAISNFVSALSGARLEPTVTVEGNTTIYDLSKYKKGIDTPISTSTEFDYSKEMLKYDYNSSEWRKLNAERNNKIDTLGMNFSKFKSAEDWEKWKKANGYASGTNYAAPGLHAIGEEEDEVIITPNGKLIPINQPIVGNLHAGSLVFNHDQIDFARKFWDIANLGKINPNLINNNTSKEVVNNYNNSRHVYLEGVEIDNGIVDIDALQRYVAVNK